MKAFTERNPKRIGAVVVVIALVMAAGVLFLHRSMFTSTYTVAARFPNAAGIAAGDTVTLAGVAVGTVSGVHLRGNAVVVDMAINHGVVIPHRTAAAIEVETVLGVLDVALQPIGGWSHPLGGGAMITDTSVPVEFQNLENTTGNLLQQADVSAFNQVLTAVDDIAKGKASQVSAIIAGLDKFTGVVDARSSQVSDLIDAADTLSATVAARDRQLASVVSSLDQVVQGLAGRASDLAILIRQTDALATQTAGLVGRNQPQIQQLLNHLQAVLAVVSQHQVDLAEGVAYLDSGLTGFASIGYSGAADIPNQWGNIFVNLLGSAGIDGILGSCGLVDQVLNQVLGPDPLPCNEQSGPPVTSTGTSGTSSSASSASSAQPSHGTSTGSPAGTARSAPEGTAGAAPTGTAGGGQAGTANSTPAGTSGQTPSLGNPLGQLIGRLVGS